MDLQCEQLSQRRILLEMTNQNILFHIKISGTGNIEAKGDGEKKQMAFLWEFEKRKEFVCVKQSRKEQMCHLFAQKECEN